MLKFELESIDLNKKEIKEIISLVENYTYKGFDMGEEEVRDIGDYLDGFNISFKIFGLNILQYTMISTLRNVVKGVLDSKTISFANVNLGSEELNKEYTRLIKECIKIRNILKDKYSFDENTISYIEPMTRTIDMRFSMSIKEFLRFVNTCSKYDELIDIVIPIYQEDRLEGILDIRTDVAGQKDLFLRNKVEASIREELIMNDSKVSIVSRTRDNIRLLNKMSVLCMGSYVAFRNITTNTKNFNIKLENPKHVDNDISININIIIPEEYSTLEEDDMNLIDKYIYGWICLINRIHLDRDYYEGKVILCHLGCFGVVFRMNNSCGIYNKLRHNYRIGKEAVDLMNNINKK